MPLSNQRKVQLLGRIYNDIQDALLKQDFNRIKKNIEICDINSWIEISCKNIV